VNEGLLRNTIGWNKISDQEVEVFANTKYSGYMEFGTGTKVVVPAGAEELAMQAKEQPKGTIAEFERSLTRWAKLKGIPQKFVFPIMMKILKVGLKPRPFFWPAILKGKKILDERMQKIYNA